ncbi:pentapeptide repeat-containing protein [Scleromatobacter humisilvae]|uniref:Pentapeptide repeat-containing protein n=1 Tax=Scleromatobacter humisilvae TaxID=2897159 RepID=A0A9X1YPV6_9BURK|nr:pentapeptide repeat-containing protein [Scleromatobacter humisilvae]MCK9688903.1 pentapeptide repeat-containing protein [Scleromatobacter humisilvae]
MRDKVRRQLARANVFFQRMANPQHLKLLKEGTSTWNEWRESSPEIVPDLSNAAITGLEFAFGINLAGADLRGADLSSCRLAGARLQRAQLEGANLSSTELRKGRLEDSNLSNANLTGANLYGAILDRAKLRNAKLVRCSLDVGSIEDATLEGASIVDVYVETNPYAGAYGKAVALALLEAQDLDKLSPESAPFIESFVAGAFDAAHRYSKEFNQQVLQAQLDRIKPLTSLYRRSGAFSSELIQVVGAVDSGLIEFLRRNPKRLHDIHWRAFEEVIAEILSSFGWSVQLTQPSKDGGYDILGIHKDISGISSAWIVECKRWHESVGIEVARSLYTVKNEMRVSGAILATTSNFTQGVLDFKSSRYDFDLKNYAAIVEWLGQYKKG